MSGVLNIFKKYPLSIYEMATSVTGFLITKEPNLFYLGLSMIAFLTFPIETYIGRLKL